MKLAMAEERQLLLGAHGTKCLALPHPPVIRSMATRLLELPCQGMMRSACLRLGPMNWSKAGFTNRVYCSMTPEQCNMW